MSQSGYYTTQSGNDTLPLPAQFTLDDEMRGPADSYDPESTVSGRMNEPIEDVAKTESSAALLNNMEEMDDVDDADDMAQIRKLSRADNFPECSWTACACVVLTAVAFGLIVAFAE